MAFLNTKNRAESSLASDINNSVTELTVASGEGANFPASNFHITIEDEILLCSSRSTDVLTVEREKEGTTAAAHSAGARVELRVTAGIIEEIQNAVPDFVFSLSDNVKNSNDANKSLPGTFGIVKEIELGNNLSVCRIKFSISRTTYSDGGGSARVYKNGAAIGILREWGNETSTYSEDFTNFVKGDLIQIYGDRYGSNDYRVQDFRLHYDMETAVFSENTLT